MPDNWAAMQFNAMVESGQPSCEAVKRLLEVAGPEGKILESRLSEALKDLREGKQDFDFRLIYCDGESELLRAPNGNYLVHPIPVIERYSDYSR